MVARTGLFYRLVSFRSESELIKLVEVNCDAEEDTSL